MVELVARAGMTLGVTWAVDEEPLLIGRDLRCRIRIADETVSRHHCRVMMKRGVPWVEDLGSANTTLVNGRPVRRRRLELGDEIGVGSVRLLVRVRQEIPPAADGTSSQHGSTVVMAQHAVAFLKHNKAAMLERGLSRTVADLADLFQLSQQLWGLDSSMQAVNAFLAWSRQRLRWASARVWLVRAGDEAPELIRTEGEVPPLGDTVANAITTCAGALIPLRKRPGTLIGIETLLVAPVVLAGRPVAVVALVSGPEVAAYDESDLQLVMAAANSFAPFYHSLLQIEEMREENEQLRLAHPDKPVLVGTSRAMGRLRAAVRKAAQTALPVVIQGETGTGKELVAHLIHEMSARRDKPYYAINCAAIPRDLFESELFGHERGAFTGAVAAKPGIVKLCDGGTLFLDEIGELAPDNQAKLLRFLDSGTFRPVGGLRDIKVDVRLIAATNRDLNAEISRGGFRKDLYYRLDGVSLHTPSLAERPSDIPLLVRHFINLEHRHSNAPVQSIASDALEELMRRPWSGNVRELRHAVSRAIVVARTPELSIADFREPVSGRALDQTLEQLEAEYIAQVLQRNGGRVIPSARVLGIARSTLYERMQKYGLRPATENTE